MNFSNWQIAFIVLGAVLIIYILMSGIVASKFLMEIEEKADAQGGVSNEEVKRILRIA